MSTRMTRREFVELGTAAAVGTALAPGAMGQAAAASDKPVRFGVAGTGNRGRGLLGVLMQMKGVECPAVCDINPDAAAMAQDIVEKSGRPRPEAYTQGEEAYRKMMERDDLDAVLIASPWHWHAPMAVYGMKMRKYTAVEVPAALSVDECWDLVRTHEATGVPCMMLENWSFRRDNLAVLNMIRQGLFGDIVHCHCAHSHDCLDHWFFDDKGNMRWGGEYLVRYNRDQYPTHSLGPVLSWLNINCGDYYAHATSMATDSRAINHYFARKFGPDHPNARRKYAQGDIVTTVVRTHRGRTIVINYDMQLPRPYDNRWMVQGLDGLYDENKGVPKVYIRGRSAQYHQWESFDPYQEKFEHSWWKAIKALPPEVGHGGTDYLELQQFVRAVREKTQTPIDVYDSVLMCVIIPLSEESIARGGAPVACPDFTGGRWKTNKPRFAMEA